VIVVVSPSVLAVYVVHHRLEKRREEKRREEKRREEKRRMHDDNNDSDMTT